MRTHKIAIFLILLVATVTGCAASSGSQNDMDWIFDTPADPIQVAVALDSARTIEAVIPVEGGTLSITGADGTLYTLDIPSDALLNETTIGMTPVTSISDMPFGSERTYAVQLSPEGLIFQNFAILTITPVESIPLAEQITFGYQGDGKDLILAAPVVDSNEIKIQVLHFSGNGVTRGLLADVEPVRQRLGGDAERRLDSALSAELIRIHQEGGNGEDLAAAFAEAFQQYEEQVLKPRVAAAGESCANGQLAIQTVYQLERWRQLVGQGEGGDPLAKYPGLRDKAWKACIVEEFEMCVEDHVIHRMLAVWMGFERQYALWPIGGESALREARDLTIKCLTFKLKFESTGTLNAAGAGYESTVTSDITLRYNPDEGILGIIEGEAPTVNEDFEWFWPCGAESVRGDGGPFKVFDMNIKEAPYDRNDPLGKVDDFILTYLPGNTSESAITDICGSLGSLPIPPFPAWTSTFIATHIDELAMGSSVTDSGYVTTNWEIFGDEYFAKKEWIKENGEIVETGTFKLYHTPGQ
jgi:hypothetical protein